MAYCCCSSLRGNIDFPYFVPKSFIASTTEDVLRLASHRDRSVDATNTISMLQSSLPSWKMGSKVLALFRAHRQCKWNDNILLLLSYRYKLNDILSTLQRWIVGLIVHPLTNIFLLHETSLQSRQIILHPINRINLFTKIIGVVKWSQHW